MDARQKRDRIFEQTSGGEPFSFDEHVADVFPDMLNRSIPGFGTILHNIGVFTADYTQPDTRCYDLGCSVGLSTLAIRHAIQSERCSIVAVDNSEAMVKRCRSRIKRDNSRIPVEVKREDILETAISSASVVVLNFTLQFIEPEKRLALIKKIHNGMSERGVLLLSEKVRYDDDASESFYVEHYHNMKRYNGYSDLEISRKRNALENVLIRDTIEQHHQRLKTAGFSSSRIWFQCYNFVSFAAFT